VAGKHDRDGNRRRDRGNRRAYATGSGVLIPATYSQDAEAHENSWFLAVARW